MANLRTSLARLLPALACAPLIGACQTPPEKLTVPVDLDRQCMPDRGDMACREELKCIRLFIPRVFGDGGVEEEMSFACRPGCTSDADCMNLKGYVCYTPGPAPMEPVCVRKEVADRLQMDGGL